MFYDSRELCGFLEPTRYLSYVLLWGSQTLCGLNSWLLLTPPVIMPDCLCYSHGNSRLVTHTTGLNWLESRILLLYLVNEGMTLGPGLPVFCLVSTVRAPCSFIRAWCESPVMVRSPPRRGDAEGGQEWAFQVGAESVRARKNRECSGNCKQWCYFGDEARNGSR